MRGQIFIVGSVLVAIALLTISMGFTETIEQENYLQNYFVGLRNELINTADSSLLTGNDVTTELDSYILFSDQILSAKGYDQEVVYTISGSDVIIDIYLAKGQEYYKDSVTVDMTVFG